jgi:hypothetical protein
MKTKQEFLSFALTRTAEAVRLMELERQNYKGTVFTIDDIDQLLTEASAAICSLRILEHGHAPPART